MMDKIEPMRFNVSIKLCVIMKYINTNYIKMSKIVASFSVMEHLSFKNNNHTLRLRLKTDFVNAIKINKYFHVNKTVFNSLLSGASFTRMAGC